MSVGFLLIRREIHFHHFILMRERNINSEHFFGVRLEFSSVWRRTMFGGASQWFTPMAYNDIEATAHGWGKCLYLLVLSLFLTRVLTQRFSVGPTLFFYFFLLLHHQGLREEGDAGLDVLFHHIATVILGPEVESARAGITPGCRRGFLLLLVANRNTKNCSSKNTQSLFNKKLFFLSWWW